MTPAPDRPLPDSPEFLARQLRCLLQRYRELAGLSPAQAGKAMSWSQRKITRIEKGEVAVTHTDVRAMLETYGVTDNARSKELSELALKVKRNAPSTWAGFAEVHTPGALIMFAHEPAARTIVKHELDVVPGLLQIEAYTRALLEAHRMTTAQIDLRVAVLDERRKILEAELPPQLDFVIGEALVSRVVSDRQVMLDQIQHLKVMSRLPNVTLRLVPLSAGVYPMVSDNFTILSFHPSAEVGDMVCLEDAGRVTSVIEDASIVEEYRVAFATLQDSCKPADEFEEDLDQIVEQRFSTNG